MGSGQDYEEISASIRLSHSVALGICRFKRPAQSCRNEAQRHLAET
jgi:hypothetical protein